MRLAALILKEWKEMIRDPSSIAAGIVLPLILLLIFGCGLSLDLRPTPIAVVDVAPSEFSETVTAAFEGSPYLIAQKVQSRQQAQVLFDANKVKAIVVFDSDPTKAAIQVIVNGVDVVNAKSLSQAIASAAKSALPNQEAALVNPVTRVWFNPNNDSSWYFIPGIIVVVMTLTGTFLTAMIVAREWEHGTIAALFASPTKPWEIVAAKCVPSFVVGLIGLILCLLVSRFLFEVPLVGSLSAVLVGSVLYLLACLGLGLLISSALKSQFLACQAAIILSFLPSVMLSGFVFDLRNVPEGIRWVAHLLPATYYMQMLRGLFLSGIDWSQLLKIWAMLLLYASVFFAFCIHNLRKTLDRP